MPQGSGLTDVEPPLRFRASSGSFELARRRGVLADRSSQFQIFGLEGFAMKIRNSLKSLRGRHRNNRLVRRKGRVYVINKTNPRFKARQG